MEYLKKVGISLAYTFGILFLSVFLLSLLNYFNIIGPKTVAIFKIILLLLSLFMGGFMNGKKSKENGWLEGLKLSMILFLIFLIISLLFKTFSFSLKHTIFYLILIGITTFGSMIGINKRIDNSI